MLRGSRKPRNVGLGIAAISASALLAPVIATAGPRASSGRAAPRASAPLVWTLKKTNVNPNNEPNPSGSTITPRSGHLDWQVLVAPQVAFTADYPAPPATLAPGKPYEFPVTLRGEITGGKNTPGYRQLDVILYLNDRWVDPISGPSPTLKQSCGAPSFGAPVACSAPGGLTGKLGFVAPTPQKPGDTFSFGVGALNCSRCYVRFEYAATGSTPKGLITTLEATREYRLFYGLDDPSRVASAIELDAAQLVDRAEEFPGATSRVEIDGEPWLGGRLRPGALLDLYRLLAKSDDPTALRHSSIYAGATLRYELALRNKIQRSSGHLRPADVLAYALEVTDGSYPLAVLTAHNLLKSVTVEGRDVIDQVARGVTGEKQLPRALKELRYSTAVVSKLASLRANPAASRDKMGPWYHIFAVLTAGAMLHPQAALAVVQAEHGGKAATTLIKRYFGQKAEGFFKGEGGFDPEKYRIDRTFALRASTGTLAALSR